MSISNNKNNIIICGFDENDSKYILKKISKWLKWKSLNNNTQIIDSTFDFNNIDKYSFFILNNNENSNFNDNSYITIDENKKKTMNNINMEFHFKILPFLSNLNLKYKKSKKIYMSRHGQSIDQTLHKIGGDNDLTEKGKLYSFTLKNYIDSIMNGKKCKIFCSNLIRSKNTTIPFQNDDKYEIQICESLNEIHGGIFEGMTYDEVKEKFPDINTIRHHNKYKTAWPCGESYHDLALRMENFLINIENFDEDIIIIAHQAVCRIIYAYLTDINVEKCVCMEIKSHRLYEFDICDSNIDVKYHDL
jgi:broad specificity phosphatase PhoE